MNYDDVIPLNEIGKIETVEVYNQAYVDKQQKRITELGELLNSTLEENKDIYKKMADLDTALEDCTESLTDARIKIKELEKENAELKKQIEKMKCCGNCAKNGHICVAEEMQGKLCGKNKDKWKLRR